MTGQQPHHNGGQVVGYVRVSSADQNLDRQLKAIGDVDELFPEKVSGKSRAKRTELDRMLQYVRKGDTVRVQSPDRLARSTRDLLDLLEAFRAKDVTVEFVDNPALNIGTPQGEFMLTVLAGIAQLERAMILERQREGIAIAKAKGVYRKAPSLTAEQVEQAKADVDRGVTKARIARDLGVSRQTLYEALNGTGVYAEGHPGRKATAGS